jgi:metallo-beta-lactamase family protein
VYHASLHAKKETGVAELEFHGAAQTVTGSMHLLHLDGGPVALDCGLMQGRRQVSREWNKTFPLPPKDVRAVLLSHAHIDHSGNLPGLVRQGFRGRIHATAATADLCGIMLADSAHIQEEDAKYWNAKRATRPEEQIEPLYGVADAEATQPLFSGADYAKPVTVGDGLRATFLEAGHLLGSACILVEVDGSQPLRILYTGDLGRTDQPILRDPTTPLPQADYLITECTYANRRHEDVSEMKERLVKIIKDTRAAGGRVVIPAFSVGRTQVLTYYLEQAVVEHDLKRLPIFVDSPLSNEATEVFRRHPECYDAEARAFWHEEGDIFGRGLVTSVTKVQDSMRLNDLREPCVIISSSGMCENGRILHHLKRTVEDPRSTVVLAGYQAEHTLGRRIADGERSLRIFGRDYVRRCRVEVLEGFSAHADADGLAQLMKPIAKGLKGAFVVHGEEDQRTAMEQILHKAGCRNVHAPAPGEKFTL